MKKFWAVLEKGAQKVSLLSYFRTPGIPKFRRRKTCKKIVSWI